MRLSRREARERNFAAFAYALTAAAYCMLPLAAQCAPPHGAAPPPSEYICSLRWPSNWTRLSVRLDLASGTWRREHARAWLEPRIQRELSLEQMLLKVEREQLSPPSHRPECEREALPARLGWEGPADELPLVLDAVWEWDRSQAWRTVHPPELQAYLADRVRLLHVRVPFEGADVLELGPSADVERLLASGRVVEVLPGVWRVDRLVNARFASWALANLAPLGPHGADALGLQPIFERVTAALSPLLTRLTGVAGFDHSFVFSRKYDSSDTPRAACDDAPDARSEQTCASTQQSVLRHDAHHDDSHVTVNILLSPPGASEASKIAFCGRFGTDQYRQLSGIFDWANATLFPQGSALIHLGELRHRAFRLSHGRRNNLILWAMSSRTRQEVAPGAWETSLPPSPECLSIASDADSCLWDKAACDNARIDLVTNLPHRYPEDVAFVLHDHEHVTQE